MKDSSSGSETSAAKTAKEKVVQGGTSTGRPGKHGTSKPGSVQARKKKKQTNNLNGGANGRKIFDRLKKANPLRGW